MLSQQALLLLWTPGTLGGLLYPFDMDCFWGGSHLLAFNVFNAFLLLSAIPVKYSRLSLCSLCFTPRPSYFSQDPQTSRTELAPDIWVLGPIAPGTFWPLQVSLS